MLTQPKPETMNVAQARFVIVERLGLLAELAAPLDAGSVAREAVLFWNTSDGWGDLRRASTFTFQELLSTRLPMGADVRWANVDDLAGAAYRPLFETRADLTGLPAFVWLTDDTSGNPCVWANHYSCEDCGAEWTDHWSCQCDDECPECDASISPSSSDWVGPDEDHWVELWNILPEKV